MVYVVGETRNELGASMFYAIRGELGANVPVVRPAEGRKIFDALSACTADRLVRSCHDLSDGGFAAALAEMAFAGNLGADVDASGIAAEAGLADHAILFSESPSRFIVEVAPAQVDNFEAAMAGVPCTRIGEVTERRQVVVRREGRTVISADVRRLKEAWQAPLAF